MSSPQESQPTFVAIAPRFVVQHMKQALAFYGQLGFATTHQDEGFAIIERDGIALHLNASQYARSGDSVCWIGVTHIPRVAQRSGTQKAPDWEMAGEPTPPSLVRTAPLTVVSRGSRDLCRLPIVPLPPFALPDQHLPSQALIKPPGPCLLIFWEYRKDQMRSSSQAMPGHRLAH